MAEESTGGTSLMATFKQKVGPLPLGVWILMLAIGGGYLWYRHNQSTASTSNTQANSDLGSAAQAANQFGVAGTMPYSGGDTYINSVGSGSIGGSPAAPTGPQTLNIAAGQDMGQIVNQIRATINPQFSWTDLWALNPHLAGYMMQDKKTKIWHTVKPVTITISSPGNIDLPPAKAASK